VNPQERQITSCRARAGQHARTSHKHCKACAKHAHAPHTHPVHIGTVSIQWNFSFLKFQTTSTCAHAAHVDIMYRIKKYIMNSVYPHPVRLNLTVRSTFQWRTMNHECFPHLQPPHHHHPNQLDFPIPNVHCSNPVLLRF
jgi:hypothetical protein